MRRWLGPIVLALVVIGAACGEDASVETGASSPADPPSEVGQAGEFGQFVACDNVPAVASTLEGPLGPTANPPDDVMGTLAGYGAQRSDTFGGLWIDRGVGTVVVAFTDDPTEHRDAVAALTSPADDRPFGTREDVAIDVLQVDNSEQALRAAQMAAFGDGQPFPALVGGGLDITRSRVSFDLIDPAPEDFASLAELVDPALACVTVTVTPEPPTGPIEVLSLDPAEQRLTCGGNATFPRSALETPVPLDAVDHPAVDAVRALFGDADGDGGAAMELGSMFGEDPEVVVLDIGENEAQFGVLGPGGALDGDIGVDRDGDRWRATNFGGCNLSLGYPEGLNRVEVYLDPEDPPTAEQTELLLLVSERACASGQPMGDRLLTPQVIEEADRVIVLFAAATQYGDQECPGNPLEPVTVALGAPLGERELLDGGAFPPAPIGPADGDP
ncbi:MAG: hypothetical protein AAF547_22835 [Actinomycetota bacterium]